MKIISIDSNTVNIQFTRDEFAALGDTLNEVRNAFSWDFSHTGWTKDQARQLHDDIVANYRRNPGENFICSFTKQEIIFLMQAMDAAINELDWEYSIRMGYTIEEARQLQAQLQEAV